MKKSGSKKLEATLYFNNSPAALCADLGCCCVRVCSIPAICTLILRYMTCLCTKYSNSSPCSHFAFLHEISSNGEKSNSKLQYFVL